MFVLKLILEPEKFLYYKNTTNNSVVFTNNLVDAFTFLTRNSALYDYELIKKKFGFDFDLQCIKINIVEEKV